MPLGGDERERKLSGSSVIFTFDRIKTNKYVNAGCNLLHQNWLIIGIGKHKYLASR